MIQITILLLFLILAGLSTDSMYGVTLTNDLSRSTGFQTSSTIYPVCTVFTLSKNHQVLFGGNDDYIHSDSYYWVDPGNTHH